MKNIQHKLSGTRALRKARYSNPRQIYSITSVCMCRKKVFGHYQYARLAAKVLSSEKLWPDAKCLAWVVMPDHIHVLIELGEKEPLPLVVQRIKSLIALSINQEINGRLPVWQRGYYDHMIRAEKDVLLAARYIVSNPIRAGLAISIGDYPYWSIKDEWLDDENFMLW